ncbi:MAG: carbon starvation protein A, partial [Methylocystis sp.]|nr:carbon starvation protein A [Methylocystis sp.]
MVPVSATPSPNRPVSLALWAAITSLGVFALFTLASARGESVNALWLVTAAVCVYLIGYRFYSRFIAERVLRLDASRRTPAHRRNDGLDYVPTDRYVLFGHHFAAIAGAGPLVGPVLAAQMGYLPATLWLLAGVVFAGAVQDLVVLFISTRRDGRSLGDLIKTEMGAVPGVIAMFGILTIMVILLAVLALVVVKALADSPWGAFTVIATLPIAVLMGVYGRYIRPGRIGELSAIGFVLLIVSIVLGRNVAETPALAALFTFKGETLAFMLIGYGFLSSMLPVWLLLAPRDYLATFLKIGTIVSLALGVLFVMPALQMPAVSRFVDGSGPVFSGSLFPFLFITIACGAVSGFHSLVASGTTPKMIADESQIRFIGYGAMLMESFVAIMALIAAGVLEPGVYFAMNSAPAVIGATPEQAAQTISSWGFAIAPEALTQIAAQVGEKTVLSRTGGAPTLAVGMAKILSNAIGGSAAMAFWYHFAILFEALFILTTIDAGTRVARFMIQDLLGTFAPALRRTRSWSVHLAATALAATGWGYFLYQGVIDPLGGINTLWPLFGIANQMLAAIALTLCTVVLFRMKREAFALVTLAPTLWLAVCTLTAGAEKLF